ncbi:NAD(P)/FAD-dependent oxidoreductase [Chitinophaga silvatica]|uniref:NAD(P)/FAD-dependent oxidoreductase n=1 Tax=Chitinophaga silvatica TaxID=2282649 RepID=A0A3E1YI67_9BACT|nr:NAD(P)/FAD-dependent oxidoreductase [Chitinophaga silvatica]RFS27037.1 NAD(P)/FAD-dependent oxidoreductase [Chitinophaga silvatica]
MATKDVIIIGGGLAGLTSAIHLAKAGLQVTVLEKNHFPNHKVCGEYISNEVLPYLQWLGIDPISLKSSNLSNLVLSNHSGKLLKATLPLGGFGISRYTFDNHLMQQFQSHGGELIADAVINVKSINEQMIVETKEHGNLVAPVVIGAYGKRGSLDAKLERNFIQEKSPWLAVKAHYQGEFDPATVALHNFNGGYCGVSTVENGIINVCYLVHYDSFKKYADIETFQEKVMYQNPHLKEVFTNSQLLFDKPIAISQISFARKEKVTNHMLMVGDTAGLIHPLCGNGMAMAIHSAQIAAKNVLDYFSGADRNRNRLEATYTREWKQAFNTRIMAGRMLSACFQSERLAITMMKGLTLFPGLLPQIISLTHGKPLTC